METFLLFLLIVLFRLGCVAGFVVLIMNGHPVAGTFLLIVTSLMRAEYSTTDK